MKKLLLLGIVLGLGFVIGNIIKLEAQYNLPIATMDLIGVFGTIIILKSQIKNLLSWFIE